MSPGESRRLRDRARAFGRAVDNLLGRDWGRAAVRGTLTRLTAPRQFHAESRRALRRTATRPADIDGATLYDSEDDATLNEADPLMGMSASEFLDDIPRLRRILREREHYWATQAPSTTQQEQLALAQALSADCERELGHHRSGTADGESRIAHYIGCPQTPSVLYRPDE